VETSQDIQDMYRYLFTRDQLGLKVANHILQSTGFFSETVERTPQQDALEGWARTVFLRNLGVWEPSRWEEEPILLAMMLNAQVPEKKGLIERWRLRRRKNKKVGESNVKR